MKKLLKNLIGSMALIGLVGCGSSSNDDSCFDASLETDTSVQWSKLMSENAMKLSEYQLFDDQTDPTSNPQERGLPYDLTTPLFTDYSSKYRYVFIPPGCTAKYTEDEIFEFPVGSTLVKTFAVPANTANRGIENEDLIETRLLIKRKTGWTALPYVWNSGKTDATIDVNGYSITKDLTHEGEDYTFTYGVPTAQDCVFCHKLEDSNMAIGPKARFLNKNYAYDDGVQNQLTKWVEKGFLSGLPSDLNDVDATPIVTDETDIGSLTNEELHLAAKAWLDINCAHCHRRDPNGKASNTNMFVEWFRDYETQAEDHGACADPVSGAGSGYGYVLVPGSKEESLMYYRMSVEANGDQMPPLGRQLVHSEGVELIGAWIDSLPSNSNCN